MRPFLRFLIVICIVAIVVGVLFKVTRPHISQTTNPNRIPSYEEVVPSGFSALGGERYLDARDAGPLLEPSRKLTSIADDISMLSCEGKPRACHAKAQYAWTRSHITYIERLPTRDHVISPEETILYRQGDSTTMSVLLAALLRSQGYPADVGITTYSTLVRTHVDGEEIRLDPACGSCGWGDIRYNGPEERITWI